MRLGIMLSGCHNLRFITLTLESTPGDLQAQIRHMYRSYRRLRQTKYWKENVAAAAATTEITYNTKTGLWHPHMHIIAQGGFLRQSTLSDYWKRSSGGSYIVHIRRIHDVNNEAKYVAKYAGKPANLETLPPEQIREYSIALHGVRMLLITGKFLNLNQKVDKYENESKGSSYVITYQQLQAMLRKSVAIRDIVLCGMDDCLIPIRSMLIRAFRLENESERSPIFGDGIDDLRRWVTACRDGRPPTDSELTSLTNYLLENGLYGWLTCLESLYFNVVPNCMTMGQVRVSTAPKMLDFFS